MADRNVKSSNNLTKKRIKKVRIKQPDPTTEEIDTYGADINVKLIQPNISIEQDDGEIQTIHIDDFN
ncbi:hypothetical protein FPV113 [Fowlpox virus]|uniref:Uncharacterized protein n=2 Tax=Fowlpox virus TaxID=10261 RepID=Q9J5A9_FOWPN|nr:hypothetical protein FPV113 [Fowlpox virus]UNS14316.1 ALPV-152 [Albatrosspox virus]WPD90818.1 hypothetical protein PPV_Vac110-fpv113 [Avipoxvirus sp.]CAE52654.1 hypothetical protein [Fowlpox virus isolate HP-438/Munich]AAF44457.1 ORF FPV113 hypothetical protein [Fowlpox virus]ART91546.1 hypothetical protein [Fowlpox virus]